MPKFVYCSVCGKKLSLARKAVRGFGRIIDLVDPHECASEPVELDLSPLEIPSIVEKEEKKFVQNLDNLRTKGMVSSSNLSDRRFEREEEVKTTAPQSLIQNLRSLQHTPSIRPLAEGEDFNGGEEDEM